MLLRIWKKPKRHVHIAFFVHFPLVSVLSLVYNMCNVAAFCCHCRLAIRKPLRNSVNERWRSVLFHISFFSVVKCGLRLLWKCGTLTLSTIFLNACFFAIYQTRNCKGWGILKVWLMWAFDAMFSLLLQVTKQHNDDCKRLLRLMGVPVIEVILCYKIIFHWCELKCS